jgi:hypothetical protein
LSPVISNIGEPEQIPSFVERSNAAVVWGSPEQKKRVYTQSDLLLTFFTRSGVESLWDIGFPAEIPERLGRKLRVRQTGIVPHEEIVRILSDCRFGVMNYSPPLATKSSVHAAFCAYGVVPLNTWTGIASPPKDVPLLSLRSALSRDDTADRAAESVLCKQWYRRHCSDVLADEVFRLMRDRAGQA